MKFTIFLPLTIVFIFYFAKPANAIIFIPAIILLPVAKVVAVIIAGLSIPALSVGVVWKKIYKTSNKNILLALLLFIIVIALVVGVALKIQNPDRSLF